ncbi:MAG TPA: DinB family protein [Acidobacteriaceae bacterium]|nr:DinB family protein [Acidobacteriaceae bacterium]
MKIRNLAVLSAILAIAGLWTMPPIQAQADMTAAAAATVTPAQVVDQLLSMVEGELVPLVEAMPADKFNFAPTSGNFKGVRTFGQQVQHVIMANYSMFGAAASIPPPDRQTFKNMKTKEQLVQGLKDSFAFGHRAIATLTPQNALETVKPVDGISTRSGIMAFAIIHMNDHFGQLVEYLRMNGIVPPSSRPRAK